MTRDYLLKHLPPYQDQWVLIHPDQTVRDIISEVLEAHNEFAPYYDKIALCFDEGSTEKICDQLFFFLKDNIKYQEETEESQTSALPSGILTRGVGDCKHYSGFSAGILDALNRCGKKINWCYRFASYKMLDQTPHHVFCVVKLPGGEIWIDPTPNANNSDPVWFTDKKIKADMAIHRNIAGLEFDKGSNTMQVVGRPYWQLMPVQGARGANGQIGGNPYFPVPFIGLQHYKEDPYSIEGTDWNKTAAAINELIAANNPGHSVTADFVKWVYDESMKGWNFYFPGGVVPGYVPNLPASWPKLIITNDGRLTLDNNTALDDYMNNEIHALTAWAQSLINQNDPSPYPVKPRHLKEFSQGKEGTPETRNLFTEARGDSIFSRLLIFFCLVILLLSFCQQLCYYCQFDRLFSFWLLLLVLLLLRPGNRIDILHLLFLQGRSNWCREKIFSTALPWLLFFASGYSYPNFFKSFLCFFFSVMFFHKPGAGFHNP